MIRLLLGSGGHVPQDRRRYLIAQIQDFLGTEIKKFLFIPYALRKHDLSVEEYYELNFNAGYTVDPIHKYENLKEAVEKAEAIYVDGGNTFRLLKTLRDLDIFEPIKKRVLDGLPYIGVSAGTMISCPTIRTTNDMPILELPTLEAFGFIPFQINCHYIETYDVKGYRGETRDTRIREYLEEEENPYDVVALREGAILRREGNHLNLIGESGKIFEKEGTTQDIFPDDPIDFLLRKHSSK